MPNTGDIVRASDFEAVKPQLSIGTVTTGEAGTDASATITGTSPNFVLNMAIPKGDTGETGPQGPSGVYTGPLKPTSSYWRIISAQSYNNLRAYVTLPSGGTWAWCLYSGVAVSTGHSTENLHVANVSAGGTSIGYITNASSGSYAQALCWRIQ